MKGGNKGPYEYLDGRRTFVPYVTFNSRKYKYAIAAAKEPLLLTFTVPAFNVNVRLKSPAGNRSVKITNIYEAVRKRIVQTHKYYGLKRIEENV